MQPYMSRFVTCFSYTVQINTESHLRVFSWESKLNQVLVLFHFTAKLLEEPDLINKSHWGMWEQDWKFYYQSEKFHLKCVLSNIAPCSKAELDKLSKSAYVFISILILHVSKWIYIHTLK